MCEVCAQLHAGDVRQLILDGLDGRTFTFVTFTAPGRELGGRVHSRRAKAGVARRCACGKVHRDADDPVLGTPVDPVGFDYDAVVEWNARCRRLLTVALQKLSRLMGRKLDWIGVPEAQSRGLLHWHCVIDGVVPAHLVQLVISGGINPMTGRAIQPAEHARQVFGASVDVVLVCDDSGRRRVSSYLAKYLTKAAASTVPEGLSAPQRLHRARLARAVRARHGCPVTGALAASMCGQRRHCGVPDSIRARFAPWGWDRCPRTRRAIRQLGHVGRTFGRSRSWPVSFADIRARRMAHVHGEHDATAPMPLTYLGRGYESPVGCGTLADLLACATLRPAPS